MKIESQLETLDREITRLERGKAFLLEHRDFLESLDIEGAFMYGNQVNLGALDREKTLLVVKHFGGKFEKTYRGDKVDCTQVVEYGDPHVCVYGGTPPETCQIVEEEVEIPARKEIRRRLVCTPQQQEVSA